MDATAEVKKAAVEQLIAEDADPERVTQVKRAVAKLEKDIIRDRIAVEKAPPRRPRHRRDPADHAARSASSRAPTAAPSSPAARRRR